MENIKQSKVQKENTKLGQNTFKMKVTGTTLWRSKDGYGTTNNNESYEMIYTESMLLLNKEDITGITINAGVGVYWNVFIRFISDYSKAALSSDVKTNGNITDIYLNNWYADDWVENNEPFVMESVDRTKRILIKIRTNANINSPFRNLTVTIWEKK